MLSNVIKSCKAKVMFLFVRLEDAGKIYILAIFLLGGLHVGFWIIEEMQGGFKRVILLIFLGTFKIISKKRIHIRTFFALYGKMEL